MGTLSVPSDCFELLYRLGQQSVMYKNVKVEYFAPYLLKEGIVQKVTRYHETEKTILYGEVNNYIFSNLC